MNRCRTMAGLLLAMALAWPLGARGQTLKESEEKARKVLDEVIQAFGGQAYLSLRDSTCEGRMANYARGDLAGFDYFYYFEKQPDKERIEYGKKRNIIYVNNGEKGWELDRAGVHDSTPESIARFQEQNRRDLSTILRRRLNEPGMTLRYLGTEIIDLRPADIVELTDKDGQVIRLVINQSTHLPVLTIYEVSEETTHARAEETERYGNYQSLQGIETPFYLARERNQRRIFEVFFTRCQYQTNLLDSLFSRESLDEVWAKLDKKKKKEK